MSKISEINITNSLVSSLNNMLSNLLSSVNENMHEVLDNLVFINSDILEDIGIVLGENSINGITLICSSLIYGFLLYYALSLLLSYLTFSQIERPAQFIFKLLLCAIALNFSKVLCSIPIFICSTISKSICEIGSDMFDYNISFSGLVEDVFPQDYFTTNSFSLFSFDGLIKSSMSLGLFNLAISYAIRYIMIKVLVIISPFAILSMASSKTSMFFKSWFKAFLSTLILQIFISSILFVSFIIANNTDSVIPDSIMHIGMLYTLFKANSFIKELFGGFTTDVNSDLSILSSYFKGGLSQ